MVEWVTKRLRSLSFTKWPIKLEIPTSLMEEGDVYLRFPGIL